MTLLVAEEDGEVVGYAACGENRDPGAAPETGELRTLFVAPAHWGSGAAQALVDAVLDDLRSRGYSAVTLWSFAENARANAFYQRAGFEPDGGERTEGVWGHVPELRLRRSL